MPTRTKSRLQHAAVHRPSPGRQGIPGARRVRPSDMTRLAKTILGGGADLRPAGVRPALEPRSALRRLTFASRKREATTCFPPRTTRSSSSRSSSSARRPTGAAPAADGGARLARAPPRSVEGLVRRTSAGPRRAASSANERTSADRTHGAGVVARFGPGRRGLPSGRRDPADSPRAPPEAAYNSRGQHLGSPHLLANARAGESARGH